jgi:hypothetical protein
MLLQRVKLRWYKGTEKWGTKRIVVWKAKFKNYIAKMYPFESEGEYKNRHWRYSVIDTKTHVEITNSDEFVYSFSEAKKKVEQFLNIMLEERIKESWWKLREKLKKDLKKKFKTKSL